MTNANQIFDNLNKYSDITSLKGMQEDMFLEFKNSSTIDGRATDDDKDNFKEAITGFAHQEGGVVVWGVDCNRDAKNNVDRVSATFGIENIGTFQQSLQDYLPKATEPMIDGFRSKIVFENDDPASNKGFLIQFFPKSYGVLRVIDPKPNVYTYKRVADKFWPIMSVADARSLFFREISPELFIESEANWNENSGLFRIDSFKITNVGKVSAKHLTVLIQIEQGGGLQLLFDGGGRDSWINWSKNINGDKTYTFRMTAGTILHPSEETKVFIAHSSNRDGNQPKKVNYKIFAENMEVMTGEILINLS